MPGLKRVALLADGWLASGYNTTPELFAQAWVGFATARPALLELMFASKNRPAAAELRVVADRAFAVSSAMIVQAQLDGEIDGAADGDEPDRIAMAIFATLQGLASLLNVGMLGNVDSDDIVGEAVDRLLTGLRPR